MSLRSYILVCLLALVLALGSTLAVAAPEYAVTASSSKIFLIESNSGVLTSWLLADLSGSSLKGIATSGNYIFVADRSTSPSTLRVGQMGNLLTLPSLHWVGNPIPLISGTTTDLLYRPSAVVVDASGGVYVLGDRWQDSYEGMHSSYCYVTSPDSWVTSTVALVNASTTVFADIATTGTGNEAIIAHRDVGTPWADQSCVTKVNGGSIMGSPLLPVGAGDGYSPIGIAAGNGFAYMVNQSTEVDQGAGSVEVGSISIIDTTTLTPAATALKQLGTFIPSDISFFTSGATNYLGIVGATTAGEHKALRIPLDNTTGTPDVNSMQEENLGISTSHYCCTSNTIFWVTNPQRGTVTTFDTASWTPLTLTIDGSASYIASIALNFSTPVAPPTLYPYPMFTQLYFVGRPFVGPSPVCTSIGEVPTFRLLDGPGGMTIGPSTGIVYWNNPVRNNTPYTIRIEATNSGGSDTEYFLLSQFPKQAEDNDNVATAKMVITATLADSFYLESADRVWGIRVEPATTHSINDIVDVRGTMTTNANGERYINAPTITPLVGTLEIKPIYFTLRWLGGGDFMRIANLTCGQIGVTNGVGVNSIGLYVKVTGKVSANGTELTSFLLDEGFGYFTKVLVPDGIALPPIDTLISVTGISSIQQSDIGPIRMIRARDAQYWEPTGP